MKNVVILANIEWSYLKQRHQFLAESLAKSGYNVIFVESAAKRNPQLKDIPRILNRLKKNLRKRSAEVITSDSTDSTPKNICVVSPFVLPSTYGIFRLLNKLFFLPKLSQKIKERLVGKKGLKLIWYPPTATTRDLIAMLNPNRIIYDCVSNFEAFENMPADTVQMEDKLISISDAVVVDCDFLYNKHSAKTSAINLIEPVVDFNLYNKPFGRIKITAIRSIAYYGGLTRQASDIGLLNFLGKNGYEVHVIGNIDRDIISELDKVIFHKAVSPHELPNILKPYDALILPYLINDFTDGVIPTKFFECFAMGLPIIATPLYNFERYGKYLITADSYEGFLKKLEFFSEDSYSTERQIVAKEHSLESFSEKFITIIEN